MTYKIAEVTAYSFLFSILLSVSHSCPVGYHGSPCHIRHCEPLHAPSHAVIKGGQCSTHYLSVCILQCNKGYEPRGSTERQCIVHSEHEYMEWSGIPLVCVEIRCPFLVVANADPPSGECNLPSLGYSTRCTFTCRTGYRLKGSKERVCQLDKSWSGSLTICEQISCPKLQIVQAGVAVRPAFCATGPVPASSYCHVRCPSGYNIQGNPPSRSERTLVCLLNETWSESIPTCQDFAPPKMTCPHDIQTTTAKGKATANVLWSIQVTDNSVEVDPNAVIRVRSSHESGQELPIGDTVIRVDATDDAGNNAVCIFFVKVRDTEPPSCSFCPADIVQEVTTSRLRVSWKRPICSDNSGELLIIESNRQSGALFDVPSTTLVQYTVRDHDNNVNNNCSFKVILTVKTCTMFPPPGNGALVCDTATGHPVCSAFCNNGADFEFNPPLVYLCSGGKWNYWAFPSVQVQNAPWPNCSGSASHSWLKMYGLQQWHYYSGDAHDPSVQEIIKSQFNALLTSNMVPPIFCPHQTCNKDAFTVSPGAIV